jgi:hypothetical protein
MAKNKISEWSATAANNTDIGGIDIAEGCAPSGINNAIRELMAQVKDQQTGTDADNFTVGGNLSVTGNTILGDASTDTLNVGNGGLVKDASGNVGIGTTSPAYKFQIGASGATGFSFDTINGAIAGTFGVGGAINLRAQAANLDGGGDILLGGSARGDAQINSIVFSTSNAEKMRIDSAGSLILAGSTAQKATGTTWSNPSDIRLKDNVTDYSKGLAELMQVNVKEWTYNGNGGTTKGMKGLGVIADEIMTVLPDTVNNYQAKLNADDEVDTDIKKFDATEITWLMLNSIKEQQAMINELKAKVAALENK